jgi:hypothetical protein
MATKAAKGAARDSEDSAMTDRFAAGRVIASDTQRLRLALDEGGWVCLRADRSGPFGPTPDKLPACLLLASDCGLITVPAFGAGEPSYTAAVCSAR